MTAEYIVLPIRFSSFDDECGRKHYMRCPEGIAESANADCAFGPHLIGPGTVRLNAKKNIYPFPWESCQPAGLSISRKTQLEGVYLLKIL